MGPAIEVDVRKAQFKDAQAIADFVSNACPDDAISRMDVAERFSQVGFLIGEYEDEMVGLVGWQVENLVIRVIDFLIAPAIDRVVAGRTLITKMEELGQELQAEASILFLPPNPSKDLINYWEIFGYEPRKVGQLPKAWREASREWSPNSTGVMLKQLRKDITMRPM